jgi:hypothetical protein
VPEIRELIGHVAARNNIRVDEGDPIFAVGTINRLMLEEAFTVAIASAACSSSIPESLDTLTGGFGSTLIHPTRDQLAMDKGVLQRCSATTIPALDKPQMGLFK